jgi:pimeloyl-ACP methyl ester carboxylesterase
VQTDLHVVEFGAGERILLVHGSFDAGEQTFPEQRELADRYRVVLKDRRGYGDSPSAERVDFNSLTQDICDLLDGGAHLVGHSYGGVLCLLAAARQPEAVQSLTVIEPPAYAVARGNPAVEALVERMAAFWAHADPSVPDRILPEFMVALGFDPPSVELTAKDLAAALTTLREPPPEEADVPLEALTGTDFPKLVVSGAWDTAPQRARETAGRAFAVICDVLEEQLPAERVVFSGAAHDPQLLGKPFNDRLHAFIAGSRAGQ